MAELTSEAKEPTLVNIGDIIRSEKFAYGLLPYSKNDNGHYVTDCSRINVDGVNQGYSVVYRDPESLTSKVAKHITVDITAHDESRGQALFVVEKAEMRDASGLYVEARRLNEDESESDELIYFHLGNGPFRDCIPEVEIVRTIDKLQEITPK